MNAIQEARDLVMKLSVSERASLAHELILSLNEPGDFDLGPSYEQEIQRRVSVVREGGAQGRSKEDVFADIRKKYA